jgi:hypothetical protein
LNDKLSNKNDENTYRMYLIPLYAFGVKLLKLCDELA